MRHLTKTNDLLSVRTLTEDLADLSRLEYLEEAFEKLKADWAHVASYLDPCLFRIKMKITGYNRARMKGRTVNFFSKDAVQLVGLPNQQSFISRVFCLWHNIPPPHSMINFIARSPKSTTLRTCLTFSARPPPRELLLLLISIYKADIRSHLHMRILLPTSAIRSSPYKIRSLQGWVNKPTRRTHTHTHTHHVQLDYNNSQHPVV